MNAPKLFDGTAIKIATSVKDDGHMSFGKVSDEETIANINRFIDKLDWPITNLVFMRIAYGEGRTYDDILSVTEPNAATDKVIRTASPITDAVITDQTGVCLLLPAADCYPVTIFDPEHKVLALVHMGWQSTSAHLLNKVIARMNDEFSTKAEDLLVYIGPGIPAEHYTFADPAQRTMTSWQDHITKVGDELGINLLSYNLEQLSKSGVKKSNIEVDPRDTVNSDELESHHHHAQHKKPPAKRFLTAVMLV